MITPILRKTVRLHKKTRNSGDFGEITKNSICLIEIRRIGVTTTLGPSVGISAKDCYIHTGHHPGSEFRCGVGISVSRIFRWLLHMDLAKSLPNGIPPEGGRGGANLLVRNYPYLSY